MLPRVLRPALLLASCLSVTGLNTAAAGDPPASPPERLTVERIADGRWPYAGPAAPSIEWVPGEDAWLEWRQDEDRATPAGPASDVLVRVDARTGDARDVTSARALDRALEGLAPVDGTARGIGRRAPPRLIVAPDGSAVIVRHAGALLHVDLRSMAAPLPLDRRPDSRDRESVADVRVARGGRAISWVRGHDVFAAFVEDAEPRRVREVRLSSGGSEILRNGSLDWVYPEEFDCTTAAWWSPDASRLVYLRLDETRVPRHAVPDPSSSGGAVTNQFYPRPGDPNPVASMHRVDVNAGTSVSLDLGVAPGAETYVPWAVWTPGGERVVVAVLDRAQTRLELRACDPVTGRGTPIWRERSDTWVDLAPPPRPVPSRNALLVKSRRDGFWRYWLLPLDPASPPSVLSSPGIDAGELLAVDEEAGVFFHARRTGDGLHEVVERVPLAGGASTTLLDDGRSHATSFSTTGRVFVDSSSTVVSPPRVVVRSADGTELRELADGSTAAFRALGLTAPEFLHLPAHDETTCFAQLWKPRDFDDRRTYPLVVHAYGGPGSRLVGDGWHGGNGLVRVLLDAGFLVLTFDGRGTGGRGRAFEAGVYRRLGRLEADDQASAVAELAKHPWVDPARVGIFGGSYGGFLALVCALEHPDVFRAAVALAPVTDWRLYDSAYTERYMGTPDANPDGYASTSIVARVKELPGSRVLVLHGLSDDNVHAENTFRLVNACLACGVTLDWNVYPRRRHAIQGGGATADVHRRIVAHFERVLGAGVANGR